MILSSVTTTGPNLQMLFGVCNLFLYLAFLLLILYWLYRQFLIHRSPLWRAAPIALLVFIGSNILFILCQEYGYRLLNNLSSSGALYSYYKVTSRVIAFIPDLSYLIFTVILIFIAHKERKSQNPT